MMLPLRILYRLFVGSLLCQMYLAWCRLTAACPARCLCQAEDEVNCAETALRRLPLELPSNTHALFLASNLISSLSEEYFQELPDLRELHLGENRITRLPDFGFRSLEILEVLDLRNNRILQINSHSFSGLVRLAELNLKGNRISAINRDAFAEMLSLEKLNLSGNDFQVSGLPEGLFEGPANLKWLEIRRSRLRSVPHDLFKQLNNLTVLDLSENPNIEMDMPSLFSNLQRMESLIIEGCELRQLHPRSLVGASSIEELRLSSNALQGALPLALFEGAARLRRLSLANNSLTHLHETLFDSSGNLEYVAVAGNPWNCGCGVLGLRARWTDRRPRFLRDGLICESPETMAGRDLWGVPLHEVHASCASAIPRISTVFIRGKGDGAQSFNCPVTLGSHVAWWTPNTEYVTLGTRMSMITGPSQHDPPYQLFQNGTLLVKSAQPGTYMCSVTFANGTFRMGGVEVMLQPVEYPDQSDIDGRGKTRVLTACLVFFVLGIGTLTAWAVWRVYRRHHQQNRGRLPSKSFIDTRPQASINPDMGDTLTYDYAYAHHRSRLDMTSDESAYAVGRLWEERQLVGKAHAGRLRPISRSVHDRGPKYYNDCVRAHQLPRTPHTIAGGEVNGYITPSQLSPYSMSVKSWKKRVRELALSTKHLNPSSSSGGAADTEVIFRPDSNDHRYLEIM